jgi:hypothetical protein
MHSMSNPILDELHAARQKLLDDVGGNFHRYVKESRKRAIVSGRDVAEPTHQVRKRARTNADSTQLFEMMKSHIIAEIQRTALENGGAPLGYPRFETVTGIKQGDWFGVYWARWSDALRDAGFQPNQFSTSGFDKDHLLRKLAELALELERLPVRGDLKLKRRRAPDFPSWNTFDRLGSKAKLVEQLSEYCQQFSEFEKVTHWCRTYLESTSSHGSDQSSGNDDVFGYVYLFKSGRYYKIGKSNSAGRREYELGIQLPERIETVHVIRTDDPPGIEEYWHKRFSAKRRNGEWFVLTQNDIRAFKRRKFM